jgi:hypothetical protein
LARRGAHLVAGSVRVGIERVAEELPNDGVAVTVGHGGERIGEMVYGEIDDAGQINIVGALRDDTILRIPGPVYFSPELVTVGRGMVRSRAVADLAGMTALALTTNPAGLGLTTIRTREGDVRSSVARAGWPISWQTDDPLLVRCVEALGTRARATRLLRHAEPGLGHGWINPDGSPSRVPGVIRYGPTCPTIAVR